MNFQEIKDKVFQKIGGDPLSDSKSWGLIEQQLDSKLWPNLYSRSFDDRRPHRFKSPKPIGNLYVCDCFVTPEPWGLPPTLTLLSLGKRLAKHIV